MRVTSIIATALLSLPLAAGCLDDDPVASGVDTRVGPDDTAEAAPDTAEPPPGDTAEPAPDAAPVDDAAVVGPPPIAATHTTSIGGWSMEPGRETTRCVVKRLDNPTEIWVSQVRAQLAAGSHHMIVYVSEETEERTEPFECTPFVETLRGQTYPILITQIRDETLTFPPGVAFRFAPNQMVRIEAHYLNYFTEKITAQGDIFFDTIAAEHVTDEAGLLFYGNPDFQVPPGETYTTPWRFLDVPSGSKVFALTGHTHAYGENVEVRWSGGAADEGEEVYPGDAGFTWDEPPVTTYDPPLTFDQDQGFRYRCTWNNTSNTTLRFGESANQEMCFFWAYYYPSDGYRLCVSPGTIGNGAAGDQVCCPGHWVCDMLTQFL